VVDNIKTFFSRPLILAAIICIISLYTGLVPCRERNQYQALIDKNSLSFITGSIHTTPSLSSSETTYNASIQVDSVAGFLPKGKKEYALSSGQGILPIQIPTFCMESYEPGKLFTSANSGCLIETGALVSCTGSWSERQNAFIVTRIESASYGEGLFGRIAYLRAISRLFFKRLMFSWGSAGALILSLLSGSRDYLDESVKNNFREAGLSHILALSGMHLSFFSGLAGSTGKKFFGKKHTFMLQLMSVLLFVWFAGLSPSLFRALLCSIILLISSKTSMRSISILEVLSGAFLVHLVVFPNDMFSAAFMLSYGALAGILTVSPITIIPFSLLFPNKISESLSSSVGAQVATAPISCFLFGELMPIGIIASCVVSPLITVFLTLALLFIICSLCIPFLSPLFGGILSILYKMIVFFVNLFAKAPPIIFS
jgi:competence protein ComEC